MELFRKVLVPLELGEFDERLMRFVAGLGRYGVGEVFLVNVRRGVGLEAPVAARQERDRGRLIASLASILTDAGVHVSAVPLAGVPVNDVLRAAGEEDASLIVAGTRGKSALNEFVAGTVSDTVGRQAKVPVLMVPYQMLAQLPDEGSQRECGERVLERIVYPTDFSNVSERMLELVKSLDGELVGEVLVTHIADPKETRGDPEKDATLRSDGRILAAICAELGALGIAGRPVLESGPVIAELLDLARERAATSFIMGSHGRGISEELFVGSVSQTVLRAGALPVFIKH